MIQVQSDGRGVVHRARAVARKSHTMSHESAIADPTDQLTSVSATQHRSTQSTQQQQHNNCCETYRVFCSAIVIMSLFTVIPQGPFCESNGRKTFVPIVVWLGFDPFRPFIITLVAELGIQPLIRSIWTETSAITQSTFSIAITVFFLRPPTVAT